MDPKVSPVTVGFEELGKAIDTAGVVSAEDFAVAISLAKGDAQELVRLCASKGLLTPFQLSAFSSGQASSLRIGNYDLLDRLGAGGMGTVYKARHRRMKRVVALKVLAANLSENDLFVKRFQREVETIACLGHPNVVMAYDADEADVGHFLVMEFVNGCDLFACVGNAGPCSPALRGRLCPASRPRFGVRPRARDHSPGCEAA